MVSFGNNKHRLNTGLGVMLLALLFLSSCAKIPTEIQLKGNFDEGDSIAISYSLQSNGQYIPVGGRLVDKKMAEDKEAIIPITNKVSEDILAFSISIYLTEDRTVEISSIAAQNIATIPAKDLPAAIWWEENVTFTLDSTSAYLSGYIYKDRRGMFANNIQSYYLKRQHEYVKILSIVFIVLSIGLFLYTLQKNKQPTLLLAALLLYIMCLPLKLSWGNWALLFLATVILILFIKNRMRQFKVNPAFYGLLGIFIIFIIGAVYTPGDGFSKLSLVFMMVIIPLLFSTIALGENSIESILRFYIRFVILYCIFILTCYAIAIFSLQISSLKYLVLNAKVLYPFLFPFPSYQHPSFVSIILAMAIPFAIHLSIKKKINRIEALLCILLVCAVITFSGARIGLIVILLTMLFYAIFYIRIGLYVKYIAAILISIVVVMTHLNSSFVDNLLDDPLRDDQRKTAVASIKEKPLFGWGTDSMETLLYDEDIADKAGLEKPVGEFNHFHNQYLDMLVQLGIIGSLPFFAFFLYLVYIAIRRKDFLLMAFLTIYLPFMFVESPFATAKGLQPMIFWLSFLLSTQKTRLGNMTSFENKNSTKAQRIG